MKGAGAKKHIYLAPSISFWRRPGLSGTPIAEPNPAEGLVMAADGLENEAGCHTLAPPPNTQSMNVSGLLHRPGPGEKKEHA
jgi:hypothetical protein